MTIQRFVSCQRGMSHLAGMAPSPDGMFVKYEDFKRAHDIDVNQVKLHARVISGLQDQIELLTNERDMLRADHMCAAKSVDVLAGGVNMIHAELSKTNETVILLRRELDAVRDGKAYAIKEAKHFSACLEEKIKENNQLKMDQLCLDMDLDTLGADMSNLIASLLKLGISHAEIKKMARP